MNPTAASIPSYRHEVQKINETVDDLPSSIGDVLKKEAERSSVSHPKDLIQLQVGDKAPDFSLKNALGRTINLYDVLKESKVVLTFYRGTWCPYCNLQLSQYQEVIFKLKSVGSTMIAISPQTPDESLNMKEKSKLSFEVLSDPSNQVARLYTAIHKKSEAFTQTVSSFGKEFETHYADNANEVPVPAVFIIEQDRTISFARSEGGDYRTRVEASEVLEALSGKQ